MPVIESPTNPTTQAQVDPTFQALRVSPRPWEWRTITQDNGGGHFRGRFVTGLTTGIAADGAIFSVRWTDPNFVFVLNRFIVSACITTAFGTGQENSVNLFKLTSFTAADSGGTTLTLGSAGRKRTSNMNPSRIQDIRVATTAALTPGTAVSDTVMSYAVVPVTNVVGVCDTGVLFDVNLGEHPLAIGPLEGIRVAIAVAQGATGVVRWSMVMDWMEIPNA